MDVKVPTPVSVDEIRLKDLLEEIWQLKWIVCAVVVVFSATALIAARVSTKMYKATAVVLPASATAGGPMGGGGLSAIASEVSGLASLAGLSTNTDSKRVESTAVLQSQALAQRYILENQLTPVLFYKLWDAQNKRWKVDKPEQVPTPWAATQYFLKRVCKITTEQRTGLITVAVTWKDPHLAARWANDLVKMTNDYLRAKTIAESQRNIAYLTEQAGKTDMVGVKQAIYSIMQNEIDKGMLARGTEEYALKAVDPAIAPEAPSTPQPLLWTLVGFSGGLIIALSAVYLRVTWRQG
jgi:uncharacterized protein involved in exopolysaccharide biosynthesis